VYVEALLHLSGGYRACDHSEDKVYANAALNLVGFVCASKSNRLFTRKEVVIVVPFLFTLYPSTASVALSAICFSRAAFVVVCLSLSSSMRRNFSA
jgi:hypothetical protein